MIRFTTCTGLVVVAALLAVPAEAAVVVFEAESETVMRGIQVCSPDGSPVLKLLANSGHDGRLAGFVIETGEYSAQELLARYGEGYYGMAAVSEDGLSASGGAFLSHDLLPAPTVLYPLEEDDAVPTNATVRWSPLPGATEYLIVLEQGENDGLTARLPASSTSFTIPQGILAPETVSHVELGAVGSNGNVTLVEVEFTTL